MIFEDIQRGKQLAVGLPNILSQPGMCDFGKTCQVIVYTPTLRSAVQNCITQRIILFLLE